VVDDGSTDGTAGIAQAYKVHVIRHDRNRGKGSALKTGFRACLDAGADAVLTLDGDGQHDPAFIPAFIRRLNDPVCDLVVGQRDLRWPGMPPDRVFSNRTSSLITSMAAGRRIPDSQCGFRLYRRSVLTRIHPETERYEMETEMLILAARDGFRIGWCPVRASYDGQVSHIRRLRDSARFLRLIGRFL
jgi:glycosyltransferase involved in cell wall biosynthesis